ncbi:MAG: exodeoxyribonuclease VII large subunit [Oscillospiraceae bacterium]
MSSILSVSQLNRYISLKLGGDLKLKNITIKGEISEFKVHYRSGHAYFVLKDDTSVLKGVMFANSVKRLTFMPQSGMNVLCSGNIEVYEAGGVYQIIAAELIPAGIGAKFMQLNAVKENLAKQGLFSAERKKPLPQLPKKIAVVTSLNGAALQDVLNILRRRYPVGEVDIFPAQVQGENAPETITKALSEADNSDCDVIILTRGGGSFEDLMPFNSEAVAVSVAQCHTPIISAVGHETDTTLADYAADKRAPTPSAAAEICAPTVETLYNTADLLQKRLDRAYMQIISAGLDKCSRLDLRLKAVSSDTLIKDAHLKLDSVSKRLISAAQRVIDRKTNRLDKACASLEALSPFGVLERGYSITLKNGGAVTRPEQLSPDDEIVIKFSGFEVKAVVKDITVG